MAFQKGKSGNPKGRPKGARTKRSEILEAINAEFGSEKEFWSHIARAGKSGDNECLRILANRLRAPLKSVAPMLKANLDYESLDKSLESLIREVAAGNVPSDQARDLIASIRDVSGVTKLVEFEERLAEMEANRARLKAV